MRGLTFVSKRVGLGVDGLRKALESALARRYVVAGLLGRVNKHAGEELTTVQIALIQEFGAPSKNIPARPFVMPTFHKHRAEYKDLLRRTVKVCLRTAMQRGDVGGKFRQGLGLIGLKMATDIKNYVTQGPEVPPPNAPSTLARKLAKSRRSRKPTAPPRTLVDTSRMINAVSWEIRDA